MSQRLLRVNRNTLHGAVVKPDFIVHGYHSTGNRTSEHWANLGASAWSNSANLDERSTVPEAATLKNYTVHVTTNSSATTDDHVHIYIEGANGNGDITITIATTGSFTDTSGTDDVSTLDSIGWHFVEGTTANVTINTLGFEVS